MARQTNYDKLKAANASKHEKAVAHVRANGLTRLEAVKWLKDNGYNLPESCAVLRAVFDPPVKGD